MSKYIGNYEIVSELGRGGMGVVYKAREESLQRFVAIKMLGNQLVDNESVALRFMREARAVADLNHPNLVQVFRVDRHEDQPYFVMEYVEGESLKRLIQREDKMQPMRALQILKEVSAGLAAAHDKGVIHRDIKPENIMLTRYGGVKVVDFGIARVEEPGTRLTTTGIGLGTPSYLSPEVCLSQDVDQRSDIFSLGVVLFEMLTGDTPFKSDSPFELMTKVVEAKIPDIKALNPNVDEGARQILAKMIAKRPKLRYQNCNELISDIDDYQAGRVPRWATATPLETEAAESPPPGQSEAKAQVDDPDAAESVDAATTPIPAAQADRAATGTAPVEPTVTLEHAPANRRTGRLALAAMLLLLLAGGAIAGSWYLITGSEPPVTAMQEPAPDATADGAAAAKEHSGKVAERVPTGLDQPAAAGPGPGPHESSDAALSSPPTPVGGPTRDAAAEETGFRFTTSAEPASSEADDDSAADEPVSPAPASEAGFEIAVAEAHSVAAMPDNEASAPARPAAQAAQSDALDRAMTEPGESSGESLASATVRDAGPEPGVAAASASRVAVVSVGDAAVAGVVARELKQALRAASFEVMDEQMIEGLVYAESLSGVARSAQDAGAGVLVYADVVPTGERELMYYGRSDMQYMARLEVRIVDLASLRNLGPATSDSLEYVALTAERKALRAAAPVARNVVNRLRAWRVMRGGGKAG